MPSFVIDSSVYISLFHEGDEFHKETQDFFQRGFETLEKANFFLPSIVLFEISNFLIHLKKPSALKTYFRFQEELFRDTRFTIYPLDHEFLMAFQRVAKKIPLKTSDAIVAFTALISKSVLISWDKRLLNKAPASLTKLTPSEFFKKY